MRHNTKRVLPLRLGNNRRPLKAISHVVIFSTFCPPDRVKTPQELSQWHGTSPTPFHYFINHRGRCFNGYQEEGLLLPLERWGNACMDVADPLGWFPKIVAITLAGGTDEDLRVSTNFSQKQGMSLINTLRHLIDRLPNLSCITSHHAMVHAYKSGFHVSKQPCFSVNQFLDAHLPEWGGERLHEEISQNPHKMP